MAELIIAAAKHSGFEKYDIIKVYRNGYYKRWKAAIKKNCFVVRLPLLKTRKIKRLLHEVGGPKRAVRVKSKINKRNRHCVTRYFGRWIEHK